MNDNIHAENSRLFQDYYLTKDPKIANQIAKNNLGLVHNVVGPMINHTNVHLKQELLAEGQLALTQAIQRYNPDLGYRFSTYATHWINGFVRIYLFHNKKTLKVARSSKKLKIFNRIKSQISQEQPIDLEIIAKELKVDYHYLYQLYSAFLPTKSLHEHIGSDSDDTLLIERLRADFPTPEEQYCQEENNSQVTELINQFLETSADRVEKEIVLTRLLSEDPSSLQEIANRFSLSRERIRQKEEIIKGKLKKYLTKELEGDSLN